MFAMKFAHIHADPFRNLAPGPQQIGQVTYGNRRAKAGLTSLAGRPHKNIREIERNLNRRAARSLCCASAVVIQGPRHRPDPTI
jgi:hypothetical protein